MQRRLKTARLELRLLTEEDADDFFALVQAERVHLDEWLPWPREMDSVDHAANFLAVAELQCEMENGGIWGVFLQAELIGCVTVHWIQWDHRMAAIGYWLAGTKQGHGFAREAMHAMLGLCFEVLELNRVEVSVATGNGRSLALARALGFVEEGVRRQFECLHGEYHDHVCFAQLASDWLASKG